MRIPSGVTDQYIYFVAVDSTDFATRETGLSSFTVYRSRNGAAAAAMTTPTINETDATNMPGVYELLVDEDTTIAAGNDSEEIVFHITAAGMAPVTRTIELYRPKITAGNTLDVTATGAAGIDWGNIENKTTANDLSGTDIQLCDTVTTNTDMRGTDSAATAANLATVDSNVDAILVDTGTTIPAQISALNDLSAADVNAEVDTALADIHLDHLFAVDYDPATKPGTATALLNELIGDDAGVSQFTVNALENGPSGSGASASAIADAVWDEALSGHTSAGSTGEALDGAGGTGLTAAETRAALGLASANLDTQLGTIDSNVDAILVDTGTSIPADIAALNDIAATDIVSNGAITTLAGAVVNVDTVDTTTTNTDMRGTDSAALASALATVDANVDAILVDTSTTIPGTLTTIDGIVDAILADTSTDGVVLTAAERNAVADAILDRNMATGTDSGSASVRTVRQALRFNRNKVSISGGTLTVTKEDDSTTSHTAAVVTTAGDPITSVDPA